MSDFNVSRETLRTPSSYKVQAVKEMLNLRAHMFGPVLALLVKHNWDEAQARYDTTLADAGVTYLPIEGLSMKLYFMPSTAPSNGIGMHMLIVKDEEPTHVLFIGFYEFTLIAQIIAGIGQFKLIKGDTCRESKTRDWVLGNVDRLSHRVVKGLFNNLEGLYNLL